MERYIGIVGIAVFIGLGVIMSSNRRRIKWRTIIVGLILQLILGFVLIKFETTAVAFQKFTAGVATFLSFSTAGAEFVFGPLGNAGSDAGMGFIFAFQVIPTIIFFSAFISIMYYYGVVQVVISVIALVMRKTMGTSGAETLSCSGNIFVGQTEAPLLIKPYLADMTNSELSAVMVGGFATVAGGVLAAYIGMGISPDHLIVASVMAAPGALMMAKLIHPETEHSKTAGDAKMPDIKVGDNALDAAARGTTDGMALALNVAAMLIAFLALIAVVDWMLGGLDWLIDGKILGRELGAGGHYDGYFPGSLSAIFGTIFRYPAYLMGVPWKDATVIGDLIGQKMVINEFFAYANLSTLTEQRETIAMLIADVSSVTPEEMVSNLTASQLAAVQAMIADTGAVAASAADLAISKRAEVIVTYALCGFANISSIGIQIGGIGALAPERRSDLSRLALKAMLAGTMVSWVTASIAGLLVG